MNEANKMIIPPGFIKTMYDMLCKRFERMNRDYLLGVAELALSSASWNVYTTDRYGTLSPIIWYCVIIPSGEGKTLPIDYFLKPVLEALEAKLETEEEMYKLYVADYTKEGIIMFFADKKTGKLAPSGFSFIRFNTLL